MPCGKLANGNRLLALFVEENLLTKTKEKDITMEGFSSEVPNSFKQLARRVVQTFYSTEEREIVEIIIRHSCNCHFYMHFSSY